jgi:hypothetical protein
MYQVNTVCKFIYFSLHKKIFYYEKLKIVYSDLVTDL